MSDARVESVVRTIAQTCVENEKYFGDLDSVVGDGDFGFSLARGFENVVQQWDTFDRTDTATFLQKVAIVMTGRIGGTSGPIWGTAFLRAAGQVKGKQEITGDDVVAMLRAAIEGIKARGGADLGEKTLLDALAPMTDTIEKELAAGSSAADIARAAAVTARDAAEATVTMQARRGRASYTGERSIGSVDPGAIAVAVLAERIADTW
ncbi:dihydroxyacetone kinase subunit DhaL [Cellulomonas sp. ICMP 17802]|uniref:dihydroxyacetone kinase subunit DhaL n=1 Tax=Cellulomonas sp. ICMP 17802 TaxID=3239199 RepID=UPI00351AC380